MSVFDSLNDNESTDARYLDRVAFFMSLKKEASATNKISKDDVAELLKSKAVVKAKLKKVTSGRMSNVRGADVGKNYEQSAKSVARSAGIKTQGPKVDVKSARTSATAAKVQGSGVENSKRNLAAKLRLSLSNRNSA